MRIVDEIDEIEKYQKEFLSTLLNFKHKKVNAPVGYSGGGFDDEIYWFRDLEFWFSHDVFEDNRYWNGFGVQNPKLGLRLSITCEINIPFSDVNRSIAGAFVEDGDNVYVVHRGNIGGSQKGVGKKLFLQHFRGEWVEVYDRDRLTKVALVGSLRSDKFQYQLREFIFEVNRIKKIAKQHKFAQSKIQLGDEEFSNEFFGIKKYKVNSKVREMQCNHGLVVSNLAQELECRGYKIANDVYRDLYIIDEFSERKAIFEVKTDINRTNLYCAIGQLFLNNYSKSGNPKLFLVLPDRPSSKIIEMLEQLDVELVTYRWNLNKYIFCFSECSFL